MGLIFAERHQTTGLHQLKGSYDACTPSDPEPSPPTKTLPENATRESSYVSPLNGFDRLDLLILLACTVVSVTLGYTPLQVAVDCHLC